MRTARKLSNSFTIIIYQGKQETCQEQKIRFLWREVSKEQKNYWNEEVPQNKFKTKIRSSENKKESKKAWPASQNPERQSRH